MERRLEKQAGLTKNVSTGSSKKVAVAYHWQRNQHHRDAGQSMATGGVRNNSSSNATFTTQTHTMYARMSSITAVN